MTSLSTTLTTPEADLHFLRRPRAGAATLVLLHGITDGGAVWARVADELEDGYDLVMPDARGHGGSSRVPEGVDVAALARDAAAIIEHLGTAPVLVWGHSMGAATAAVLAATRPDLVRGIVLEDPPFLDAPPVSSGPDDDDRAAGFQRLLSGMGPLSPEERVAVAARLNPQWHADELLPWADTKAQFDMAALAMMGRPMVADWRATTAAIACPTLLVTGDPALGGLVTPQAATEIQALLPVGAVAHFAGSGHNIHRDRFGETLAAVTDFLDSIATST